MVLSHAAKIPCTTTITREYIVCLEQRQRHDASVNDISVFTDGSCDQPAGIGGWAAIVLADGGKVLLSGRAYETTHQRMELTAAVEAIRYIKGLEYDGRRIFLYTDSQYLADLPRRKNRLLGDGLKTRRNRPIANADLLLQLFQFLDSHLLELIKVQSHQKKNGLVNYNREVDKCSRKVVRDTVRNGPDKG